MHLITRIILLIAIILGTGCATTSYQKIVLKEEYFESKPLVVINNVPFEKQTPNLCGPTALYMMTKQYQPNLTLDQVTQLTYTPAASGAFKQDMLAGARRLGMATYKVNSLTEMVVLLAAGSPVLVFHRTKFIWKDYWHYSVVVGYNRPDETFLVHIGPYAYEAVDMSQLLGSWEAGGSWAYAIMPPGKIPPMASFHDAVDNGLAFLRLNNANAALAVSKAMVNRWPKSYEADVLMAEALLKTEGKPQALAALKTAFRKEPENPALREKIRQLSTKRDETSQKVLERRRLGLNEF